MLAIDLTKNRLSQFFKFFQWKWLELASFPKLAVGFDRGYFGDHVSHFVGDEVRVDASALSHSDLRVEISNAIRMAS